jgi:hypothetical protein
MRWLIPRLYAFSAAHPAIEVGALPFALAPCNLSRMSPLNYFFS